MRVQYAEEFESGISHWRSLDRPIAEIERFVMGQLSIGDRWVRAVHLRFRDGQRVTVRLLADSSHD